VTVHSVIIHSFGWTKDFHDDYYVNKLILSDLTPFSFSSGTVKI